MPSELHNELAKMSLRWLRGKVTGRGMRGGFEVPLLPDYIADAVALCCFQRRFAERFVGEENFERVDHYMTIVPEVVCVFEAKATRSDFLATFTKGNRGTPIGNLHWCVAGRKVTDLLPSGFPSFWGILEVRGTGLQEVREPSFLTQPPAVLDRVTHQILWYAKNNHDRYATSTYGSLEH